MILCSMIKTDRESFSMSNESVDRTVEFEVNDSKAANTAAFAVATKKRKER